MSAHSAPTRAGALAGIRVLDIAGPFGNYCGKLFSNLGADVILVEPPQGAPSRRKPPFGEAEGQRIELSFVYENAGKRSLALDLETEENRRILRRLAASADLLVESHKPGAMASRGLGPSDLRGLNPRLVYTSITGFGQSGPYADYECEDIIALALGGLLSLAGEPGRPPLAAYGFQAIGAANVFGAVASLIAVMNAERTGRGDFVDVSMQECVAMGLENAAQFYDLEKVVRKRTGSRFARAGLGVFPCRDGLVFLMAAGVNENKFWFKTLDWLSEAGAQGVETLRGEEWLKDAFLYTDDAKRKFAAVFEAFAKNQDAETLYAEGQKRRIPICPVRSPKDIFDDRQLAARQFFVDATNWYFGPSLKLPGAPYKLSATPWSMAGPAPAAGQHNAEILAELEGKSASRKAEAS